MDCKKMKDRLLTDYPDGELGAGENAEVEKHLAACADCREFYGALQEVAVVLFKEAGEIQPDDIVWRRIQERISAENSRSEGGFWKLVDLFISRFPLPVPVMRGAFAAVLVLGVVVLARWPSSYADPVYGYMSEQMTFMTELGAGNTELLNGELKDYDMALEEISR